MNKNSLAYIKDDNSFIDKILEEIISNVNFIQNVDKLHLITKRKFLSTSEFKKKNIK